jgi:putative membrane-bound dehydrogenase-like protein
MPLPPVTVRLIVLLAGSALWLGTCGTGRTQVVETYSAGVAKLDITPDYPVRLNGFGFRRSESEGVTQRVWARALAIDGADRQPFVLIAVDNLGIPRALTEEMASRLAKRVGLKADRLALTATHTHTAPMLRGVAPTIFGQPIPKAHQEHIDRYTAELTDRLEKVAVDALADRKPARLSWGIGKVTFAINRRTKGGPVDHDLPVLVVRDPKGKVRAIYTSYACHCVTLSDNKISGDWAGFAASRIELDHAGAVALITIGCGGDANPRSGVTGANVAAASEQGAEVAAEVRRLLNGFLAPLHGKLTGRVVSLELPLAEPTTRAQWEEKAKRKDAIGYHARVNLARLDRREQLPTKVDYSVQAWNWGDGLAMVFLPGEVVVDYALRLKNDLDPRRLWITAYANDAPCYIPSERILKEGGYEGGGAMVYYDLPGPFRPGLEQKIIDAVHQAVGLESPSPQKRGGTGDSAPLSPQQSAATIRTKDGLSVQLVAAEPLVTSPVAIDFGPDGKLYVVEMCDYPEGTDGKYRPGGRVKVLEDTDGDGIYDKATVFLDNIPFPTGVTVWRKGVLVCAAPDILYAEDTDGDGKADVVRKVFSGFGTENYQARVNSLCYGLDGWVYGSCGLFGGTIRNYAGRPPVVLGNRDFRCKPDEGMLEPATGRTQQGRARDDWGNWFGCDNTNLCWHYPLLEHYLRRNPHVAAPPVAVNVPGGPDPNRLFPISKTLQLFKLSGPPGRTTAACGLGVYRDDLLGKEYSGNVFVCEPVNLLVHRLVLEPRGSTFAGHRAKGEESSEFLASTDTWFRPVQVRSGPDGCLWVVDMYRYVIEHPRWIPKEDLAKLDLRAGSTMGRIYRIVPSDGRPRPMVRLDRLDNEGLVKALDSPNGPQRDLAGQMLLWRREKAAAPLLERLARTVGRPEVRMHALCVLDVLGRIRIESIQAALSDKDSGVRRHAARLAGPLLDKSSSLSLVFSQLVRDRDAQVRLQMAFTLGEWDDERAGTELAKLALRHSSDDYLTAAVLSSLHRENLGNALTGVMRQEPSERLAGRLLRVAAAIGDRTTLRPALVRVTTPSRGRFAPWQLAALAGFLDATGRQGRSLVDLADEPMRGHIECVLDMARHAAADGKSDVAERQAAVALLGRQPGHRADDLTVLGRLLTPQQPPALQTAALTALGRIPDDSIPKVVMPGWRGYSPALKPQVLDLLLSRDIWRQQLLSGIEKGQIPASHIDAGRRQRMLAHKDATFRKRAAQLFEGGSNPDRRKVLESYREATSLAGDRARGKMLFAKNCAACHALEGVGHAVGPDLAAMNNKSPAYLLEEILDPNRNVDSRYVEYVAATKAGLTFNGILAAESAASITLRGQDGKEQILLRTELEELSSTGRSLMPEGLEKELSKRDLADLIAYLSTKPSSEPRPSGSVFFPLPDGLGLIPRLPPTRHVSPTLARRPAARVEGGEAVIERPVPTRGFAAGHLEHNRYLVAARLEQEDLELHPPFLESVGVGHPLEKNRAGRIAPGL